VQADDDVVAALLLKHLRRHVVPERRLDGLGQIVGAQPNRRGLRPVRLIWTCGTPTCGSTSRSTMPGTAPIASRISPAFVRSTARSGPNSLMAI
jgi:hypothetical protein